MRLIELHLDRYGPFTDRRLVFDATPPLIVVHGQNEAGKTSALAALTDALYGIEKSSAHNFLHDYGSMRVGLTLELRDGRQVRFRRRKGNMRTILDTDENPIEEDVLLPFLGRIDRALFLDAFGLDQKRLRSGSEKLSTGEGSLGEALLAAAPGLGRLVELRREFNDSAQAIFTPERRVASKPIYAGIQNWHNAKQKLSDATLGTGSVKAAMTQLGEASQRVQRIDEEKRAARANEARLGRLRRALPHLAALARSEAELADLGVIPAVGERYAERVSTALAAAVQGNSEHDDLIRDHAALADERDAIAVPLALLEAGAVIDRLSARRSAREAAEVDRIDAGAEARRARAGLSEAARRLGLEGETPVLSQIPSVMAIARVRRLISLGIEARTRFSAAQTRRSAAVQRRSELGEAQADGAFLVDPGAVRATLEVLGALAGVQSKLDMANASVDASARRVTEAVARFGLPGWTAEMVRSRALPERHAIERFAAELEQAQRAEEIAETAAYDAVHRAGEIAKRIGSGLEGAVPTQAAVLALRGERDQAWEAVRTLLFADEMAPAALRADASRRFERAAQAADQLADVRADASDLIAQNDAERAVLSAAENEANGRRSAAADARMAHEAVRERWSMLLGDFGLPDMQPRDVLPLLERQRDVLSLQTATDQAERDRAMAAAQFSRLLAALAETLADFGLSAMAGSDWQSGLARLKAAAEAREKAWLAARDREAGRVRLQAEIAEAEAEIGASQGEVEAWAAEWREALAAIGLSGRTAPEEADSALDVWAEVREIRSKLSDATVRLERAEEVCGTFDSEANLLILLVEYPDGTSTTDRIARLAEALEQARRLSDRRTALTEALGKLDVRIRAAGAAAEAAGEVVNRLRVEAEAAEDADLAAVAAAVEKAGSLRSRIQTERQMMMVEAGGLDEATFGTELAVLDADLLIAEENEHQTKLLVIESEYETAVSDRANAKTAYEGLMAREGAEVEGQQIENVLAGLSETAEQWRILQAASRLAGAVVEEFRKQHQSPVLADASRLFSRITHQRYASLAADYTENGAAQLVVVRADGRRLEIGALSEGTKDQLFLALRLATLLEHSARAEPLPFIGDDLFVTFDEERTAAGLETLAEFGRTAQAVLFTHHAHVVDIAVETLAEQVQVLRL